MTDLKPKILALLLSGILAFTSIPSAYAQEPVFVPGAVPPAGSAPPQNGVTAAPGLRIVVLEGQRRPNRLTEGIFAMPVVEIRNSNDRPVEGAQVVFTLPGGANGAGATFRDGSLEKTFSTNAQGQASAEGYIPNAVEGKYVVRVKATYQEENVVAMIAQSNTFELQADADRKKSRAWRKWLWIGGGAAAATVLAIVLLRGSDGSGPSVITVTPGPPVLGGR